MSNSVDPDEMAHYEPSHLDLCCLQKNLLLSPVAVKELMFLQPNLVRCLVLNFAHPSIGKIYSQTCLKQPPMGSLKSGC